MTDTTTTKTEQHWPATIVACVLIAALAVIYVVSSPDQRSQILLGAGTLGIAIQSFMPAIRRTLGIASTVLVLCLGASTSGCGASLPVVLGTTELVAKLTCDGARAVCEATGYAETAGCKGVADVCDVIEPTSGGESSSSS
jgi:hypothetical protein